MTNETTAQDIKIDETIMNSKFRDIIVSTALSWWADKLFGHTRLSDFDNGCPENREMGMLLGGMLRNKVAQNTDMTKAREAFMADATAKLSHAGKSETLSTDYGPDYWFSQLISLNPVLCDISGLFPIKTCMWVNANSVSVSAGYQAPSEYLWINPEVENCQFAASWNVSEALVEGNIKCSPAKNVAPKFHVEMGSDYSKKRVNNQFPKQITAYGSTAKEASDRLKKYVAKFGQDTECYHQWNAVTDDVQESWL